MRKLKYGYFHCVICGHVFQTLIPRKDQVQKSKGYWDSAIFCSECGFIMFKEIYPDGMINLRFTVSKTMEVNYVKKNK